MIAGEGLRRPSPDVDAVEVRKDNRDEDEAGA